jgi:hypothetical protein
MPPPDGGGGPQPDGGGGGPPDGGAGGAPDGSVTCSQYGQLCNVSADCCNGVPCSGGRCQQTLI